jgi:hypothetical protein
VRLGAIVKRKSNDKEILVSDWAIGYNVGHFVIYPHYANGIMAEALLRS